MSTFASVWAVKTTVQHEVGDEVQVTLKSGKTKMVRIGQFLYEQIDRKYGTVDYFYFPAQS